MKSSFESHSFAFSPQAIEFAQETRPALEAFESDDPAYLALKSRLDLLPEDSLWRKELEQRLSQMISQIRSQGLSSALSRLENDCLLLANQSDCSSLKESLASLRLQLQQTYLPLLQKGSEAYLYLGHLLNAMDALGLASALIFKKAFQNLETLSSDLGVSNISWSEFQRLLAIKNALFEISECQQKSDKRPVLPLQQKSVSSVLTFVWQAEQGYYQSPEGIPLSWYQQSYAACIKRGFRFLQVAIQSKFQSKADLELALRSFYLALYLNAERAEAPFILACLAALLNQSSVAADFLEYALKYDTQPEMAELLHLMQKQARARHEQPFLG